MSPTLTAATLWVSGKRRGSGSSFCTDRIASIRAIRAPVILAVLVPPSASNTSQSTVINRSPNRSRSATARRLRPIKRWISVTLPSTLPPRSRDLRGLVLPGSMLYSAVIQPFP